MASLLEANQFVTTTLNGSIDNSQTTSITLASTTGIDISEPGIVLINYADPIDTSTAEWIEYSSINGSKVLQGVVRGSEGYSAKAHSNGVQVAFPFSESHINRINAKLNGTDTIDADLDIGDTYNIQYNSLDPYRTISLPAAAWNATTTAGCAAVATVEAGTNDIDYQVLDFDASSDENAFCNFQMPDSWDAGVVQFRYVWTNAGGGSAETVTLELSGISYADNDPIDAAVGTAVELADTWIAQGDVHQTAWSGDVTLAGTPAAGEWVHFEIMRDVSSDDLTGDLRLISVQIRYKQAQFGD